MIKLFLFIYSFFRKRRALLFLLFSLLLAFFIFIASKIKLEENILQMLPNDKNSAQLTAFMENSKFSDRIMVVISDKDTLAEPAPDNLIAVTDYFVDAISDTLNNYIAQINYRANDQSFLSVMEVINEHLPVFIDDNDYAHIDSITSREGIRNKVESNYRALITPSGVGLKKFIAADPLGLNFIALKKLDNFKGDEQIDLYDNHFLSGNRHHALMFINPRHGSGETQINNRFFTELDAIVKDISDKHPNYSIHYFGAPAVAAGNSMQIRSDTTKTLTITVIVLLLIFLFYFRKPVTPLLVLIPVVFGGLFALTVIYFLKGTISVISIGAGSLVLGIAVNYSLHFLTHYKYHPNIKATIRELAFPMTAGSLTTIGGFLCLKFVEAPVLQDLGLYAALSLAGAAIATLIFLPHFISQKHSTQHPIPHSNSFFNKISEYLSGNKKIAILFFVLTPVFLYFARDVSFETDMYKINYMSEELKKSETIINQFSSYYQKSIFTIASGNTVDGALAENEKNYSAIQQLHKEGKILAYTNVSSIFPSRDEQARRIKKWETYWSHSKRDSVYSVLVEEGTKLKFKETAFLPFKIITEKTYPLISDTSAQILKTTFLNNFIEEVNGNVNVIGFIKTTPENSAEIYSTVAAGAHTFLFDRKYITDKLVEIVNNDFNFITLWTSLLVFVVLLLIYGRIELALISFIPMVFSWIWILGIMAIFDIKFNIINIVLSTLIFALGDDFCIFTTDGLQQAYARASKTVQSTAVSITLSAATTITGMGVLIFAAHPALQSIALVSIIGIFSVWMMSQVLQPFLFRLLITNPTRKKHEPYTFFNILKSIFAFGFFVLGALLLSGLGFLFYRIIPIKSESKKYYYHVLLSTFAGWVIYIMPNVRKTIINEYRETFEKPGVIIANHSSFLDILLTVMLHPKLILLTNKWVWNSPFFGVAVRIAEYYPVADGAENTIARLSTKVAEGYSIVVFPEGTRAADGKIGRFHKGAFYLAEHLKIDIIPILIHGAHYTMTKGFFFLKNGRLTVKILPRIKFDDPRFGTEIRERAKLIGRYFRKEHFALATACETPSYFRNQLKSNFIFKGPVLEWYMRIKVKLENNYELFNELVPRKGTVVDIGCGYGFLSYILGYTSVERSITGLDYDEEKIEIAQNGYLKGENVNFAHANALEYEFETTDTFIINDVLHYLQTADQISLLKKCINQLSNNGRIIVRDGIKELSNRHKGTKLTELFSTKILGFNKTQGDQLNFISSKMLTDIAAEYNLEITEIDNTRFTSNVIFVLKKRN